MDISGQPPEAWKTSLEKCDLVIIVTDSGPDGLNDAKTMATSLTEDDPNESGKGLIIVDRDGALSDMEFSKMKPIVENTVGVPLLELIPHDLKVPLEFETRGLPVTLADPKRPVSVALRLLSEKLVDYDPTSTAGDGDDE